MANRPFELVDRVLVDGGLRLIFSCSSCEGRVSLTILDKDALQDRYPVTCACGAEVNMYFGSPRVARSMLRALKREAEAVGSSGPSFHLCDSPLMN
jgi:hypothetical protein